MKNLDDLELLREFARTGSEEPFSRLVSRYAPLVYSTGLRVAGSPEAARDITQSVFIDLLQRVSRVITSLERERSREAARASLAGWLHRAARYEALDLIRSENRRQTREKIAMELQEQSSAQGSEWNSVRPVLDEALDSLDDAGRRAVLLRYFQEASYRDVGASFGISEDAAQKRVSRALDRLRDFLLRKGIATSSASLAAGLGSAAIESTPPDLAQSIAHAGFLKGEQMTARGTFARQPFLPRRVALPLAAAFTALLAVHWFVNPPRPAVRENEPAIAAPAEPPQPFIWGPNLAVHADAPPVSAPAASEATVALRVVSADTRLPLDGVLGIVTATMDGMLSRTMDVFHTDADGYARVAYTNGIFGMKIDLSLDGFASTQLSWKPARGQPIPEEYTLRMAAAPRIGGFVLDEEGAPVSDAWVQFTLPLDRVGPIGRVESFYCPFNPRVFTDANGYFETKRIALELLPEMQLTPSRHDFLWQDWLTVSNITNGVEQLLSRKLVLKLKRGLEVRGMVLDPYGSPAPGVLVRFGSYHSNQRFSTSSVSGEFILKGCTAGTNIVTVFDRGLGAGFQLINVSTNTPPCLVRLESFRTLHVQTVDSAGAPVPDVDVVWQSVDQSGKTYLRFPGAITPQYSFRGRTDTNGEITWPCAPAGQVLVSFYPKHHVQRHNLLLNANGSVQTVTLEENYPPQIIQGTVRDAFTGALIPAIRVRQGFPSTRNGVVTPSWNKGYQDVIDFGGGHFRLEFEYSAIAPPSRFDYLFEFSAEGYEESISRIIRGEEGNVELDIFLEPVPVGINPQSASK